MYHPSVQQKRPRYNNYQGSNVIRTSTSLSSESPGYSGQFQNRKRSRNGGAMHPHPNHGNSNPTKKRRYYSKYERLEGNLHQLTLVSPSKAIYEICYHFDEFKQLIQYSCQEEETLVVMLKLLSQILNPDKTHNCHRELNDILKFLLSKTALSLQESYFFPSLATFLRSIPMVSDKDRQIQLPRLLSGVVSLFETLLDVDCVMAAKHLPVDECVGTAEQLSMQGYHYQEINEKAQQLLKKRNKVCSDIYESKMAGSSSHVLSIALPTTTELHNEPERRENIVDKPFPSVEDYLKIQRDLLREDFINPLRLALAESSDKPILKFTNVQFNQGQTITSSGAIAYKLSFQTSRRNINWHRSKALMYGALVCLSEDKFRTILYATVIEREPSELEKKILTVQLQDYDESLRLPSQSQKFTMIESPGYFEAYAPVIKKLNEITPADLPFLQYLVELQKEVHLPEYLREKQAIFNLKGIVCDCQTRTGDCAHSQMNILDDDFKQELSLTRKLDTSQRNALHLALTKELALIQGPPGTGKTYIGVKLIQALLQNDHFWKHKAQGKTCPIVVVCYTNHALDQFLEEIIDLNLPKREIIRVGARCKSEKVKKFNLKQKVFDACRGRGIFINNTRKRLQTTGKKVEALGEFLNGNFTSKHCQMYCSFLSQEVLVHLNQLCDMTFPHLEEFRWSPLKFASWLDESLKEKLQMYDSSQDEDVFQFMEEDRYDDDYGMETNKLFKMVGEKGVEAFVRKFGKVRPLPEHHASKFLDPGDFSSEPKGYARLRLFKYCLKELLTVFQKQQEVNADEQRAYDMQIEEIKVECLQKADIVGLTTTVAARENNLLSRVESKILIVEEAAEVLEPQLVATLTKHTQHLILIGDHKQLRPKTNDYTIGHKYKLEISMFERLVSNRLPHATLTVQHRMRPEIARIVSDHIYDKQLEDHSSTHGREGIRGMKHNLFFINHDKEEELQDLDLKSHSNVHEASFLAAFCKYLLQQQYTAEEITVITPYVGQFFELRTQFKLKNISDVRITTIDNYQGEENEIILMSLVRSNKQKKPGFVADKNRICVALSRARCGLYCIGNFDLFQERSELWSSIVEDAKSRGFLGDKLQLYCSRHEVETDVCSATDFNNLPDGGCDRPCQERYKGCNHVCTRRCHPDDRNHEAPCEHPCPKRCPADLHWCKRLCGQDCGNCKELVKKTIPKCNHEQAVPCYKPPEQFKCKEKCPKELPCGHKCTKKCGEICTEMCTVKVKRQLICGHESEVECYSSDTEAAKQCKFPCGKMLACGHPCSGECGKCRQGRLHVPCKKSCTKKLLCGHTCTAKCSEVCPPCKKKCAYSCEHGWCGNDCKDRCKPCTHRCEWKCRHDQCKRRCGNICSRKKCDQPCTKRLKDCGHPCLGLCGETCPPVCHKCDTVKEKVHKIYSDEKCHEESARQRYIVLEDCQHVFSVQALDRWMKYGDAASKPQAVEWLCCPLESCKTPVMSTLRYANTAKRILCDMNNLKRREANFLSSHIREKMKLELSQIDREELKRNGISIAHIEESDNDVTIQKCYVCAVSAMDAIEAEESVERTISLADVYNISDIEPLNLLLSQAKGFISWIRNISRSLVKLTEQVILDMIVESTRLALLKEYYELKLNRNFNQSGMFTGNMEEKFYTDEQLLKMVLKTENHACKLSELEKETMIEALKCVIDAPWKRISLSKEEEDKIISTIGAAPGTWYRCPEGHYYNVSGQHNGDEGVGRCPECTN